MNPNNSNSTNTTSASEKKTVNLTAQDIKNLTGFFDVLIQMDLAIKPNAGTSGVKEATNV